MKILIINFNLKGLEVDAFKAQAHIDGGAKKVVISAHIDAMDFRGVSGLISKYFLGDEDDNVYGGCYIFKDAESLEAYKKGPIFEFLSTHENFDNFTTKEHNVIDGPSIIAGAKTDTIG